VAKSCRNLSARQARRERHALHHAKKPIMRALVVKAFGTYEHLAVEELPDLVPSADEIVISVRATVANFVDILTIAGTYQFKPKLPFVPGKCPAGVVHAVGANVAAFKPGDRVLALAEEGGYAELCTTTETKCIRLPQSMPFADAASMSSVFDTAWFALRERARMEKGEIVLVLGASGGVGLAAVQLAKAFGAHVLAGLSNPEKADLVRDAGADHMIDLACTDLKDNLRAQVFAATRGRGADIVLDMLGGDVFDAAIRTVAWCGRLVVIGFAAGRIPTIKTNYLLVKNISASGLQVSDYRRRATAKTAACWAELFAHYEAGTIRPLPTTAWPLSRCAQALAALHHRTVRGRIVLTEESCSGLP
jgi:NADPH:quinone reductase